MCIPWAERREYICWCGSHLPVSGRKAWRSGESWEANGKAGLEGASLGRGSRAERRMSPQENDLLSPIAILITPSFMAFS